jgi:hypothetical protein
MGTRDRPHKEVKKKAQAKDAKPKLQPLLEPPTNVEIIKPRRKPRTEAVDEG